jgi:hypothetical protein
LLSNVGINDPSETPGKLLELLDKYDSTYPILGTYIPKWIKDYIVYNDIQPDFESFVKKHDLYLYYPELFLFNFDDENILDIWNKLSNYNVAESKFYLDDKIIIMTDYFRAVLLALHEFIGNSSSADNRKRNFEELIIYRISNKVSWYPFKQALFYPASDMPDKQIVLPGHETFYCKNGRWTTKQPIFYSNIDSIIGFIIRKTEACLRELYKFKFKLRVNTKPFNHRHLNIKILSDIIEKAVTDHYKYINRTIVKVDHANLERIRVEALDTQDKLIVPENDLEPIFKIETDSFTTDEIQSLSNDSQLQDDSIDEWDEFKEILTDIELRALYITVYENTVIKAFADENGLMLEVLADNINEKSMDIIGDSILEVDECLIIYEDYMENVINMIK